MYKFCEICNTLLTNQDEMDDGICDECFWDSEEDYYNKYGYDHDDELDERF